MDTTIRRSAAGVVGVVALGTALGLAFAATPERADAQMEMERTDGIPEITLGVRGGLNFPNDDFAPATLPRPQIRGSPTTP